MRTLLTTVLLAAIFAVSCTQKSEKIEQSALPVSMAAVTFIAGTMTLERGTEGTVKPEVGQKLYQDDILVTGENSSADIAVKDFGIIKLGASTRITLAELKDTAASIRMDQGEMVSLITRKDKSQNYNVVTPTAVAGVRGTIFFTSVKGDQATTFGVVQGSIAVQKHGEGEEYILTEDTELEITRQRKLSKDMIRPLSDESLQEIKRLSVFHRTNVGEFNSLVEEIRNSIPEFRELDSASTMEQSLERRSAQESRMAKERVQKAESTDLNRHVKRDTEGDPLKLQTDSGYEK